MTDKELMQQALEALERCVATCFDAYAHEQVMSRPEHFVNQNIIALRERLAQPERWIDEMREVPEHAWPKPQQEPVAWVTGWHDGRCVIRAANPAAILPIGIALYTTPPRREWVGLTNEEVSKLIDNEIGFNSCWGPEEQFARAIEAKLKEKNNG